MTGGAERGGKGRRPLGLYVHIPFCVRKCLYCDFLSAPADEGTREAYVGALIKELRGRLGEMDSFRADSVFFGGGTPSFLTAAQIGRLMEAVRESCALAEDAEITLEVNPGTADDKKLRAFRQAGINRLSIGLQSADDRELLAIGRIHTWEQFLECYGQARRAGFENINIDLMSALPGQNLESWRRTLERVLALLPQPEHISAYSLILEEGTPLYDRYREGLLPIPDEEADRVMYRETKRMLEEEGYHRYEISNYAKEGRECRHNCGYWTRKDYLGFGIGAASLMDNVRFKNGEDLERYLSDPTGCRETESGPDSAERGGEESFARAASEHAPGKLSEREQMEEFMFLGLRLVRGVDRGEFAAAFGSAPEEVYGGVIRRNIRDGLLEYQDGGRRLALTERGLDLSNYVMAQFLFD